MSRFLEVWLAATLSLTIWLFQFCVLARENMSSAVHLWLVYIPLHAHAGYMYCNMPELKFKIGKRVRVYVMALGTQEDLHSPNIMGEHRQPLPV